VNGLVGAHLLQRVVRLLHAQSQDTLHTLDLANGNRTTDAAILAIVMRDERIVVTKDSDLVISFR